MLSQERNVIKYYSNNIRNLKYTVRFVSMTLCICLTSDTICIIVGADCG